MHGIQFLGALREILKVHGEMHINSPKSAMSVVGRAGSLRAAAAHHCPLVLGHIATESLLFLLVETPFLLEWVETHLHDSSQDLSIPFTLHAFNDLVENPSSWHKLFGR